MHIMDQIIETLENDGWDRDGADYRFTKSFETGGAFGTAKTTLVMDETGRWLESINGWGHVEKCVDLRNFQDNPKGAISQVLDFSKD